MNFVVDEDMPRSTSKALEELGHNVFDVRDHKLRGANDLEVFKFAQAKQAILLSGDMGFSNILQFPLGDHFGIIIAHFPNEITTQGINKQLTEQIKNLKQEDITGNLVIVEPGRIRIKRK